MRLLRVSSLACACACSAPDAAGAFAFAGAPSTLGPAAVSVRGSAVDALPLSRSSTRLLSEISGGGEGGKAVAAASASASASASEASSKSSMTASIFNLVKNICGAGMLSLPAGVAAFSSHPGAMLPATAIITALGILSGYTFSLIGRSCSSTKADSYEQAWARSVSEKSAAVPAAACIATCFAGCLAFTLIASDSFSSLLAAFGVKGLLANRKVLIGLMSVFVLLPLSLIKNLGSLGFTSMLGTGGLLYTAGMMGKRYFDGSYLPGGKFAALISAEKVPAFAATPGGRPLLFLVLVSMLGTAYEAHFNAPLFYRELKDNTVSRFNTLVTASFGIAIATMTAVTSFGYLTFGGAAQGYILNNYASSDMLAMIARLFVGLSIVFSYPLCFVGLRDGILEMKGVPKPSDSQRTAWTVGLLGAVSTLSLFLRDLGFVNSFGGALIASLIIYICPAGMYLAPLRQQLKKGVTKLSKWRRLEFVANYGIVVLGIAMGLLGAGVSVLETFFPAVLAVA